MGEKLFGVK